MSKSSKMNQLLNRVGGIVVLGAAVLGSACVAAQMDYGKQPTYINWTMPGLTISSPSGYGADWGQVFVGGGYQNKARGTTTSDGAIGAGFGLGDANKYVGVEASVSVFDVSNWNNGGANVKIHRNLPEYFSVAIGSEGLVAWGDTKIHSYYGTVSKIFFIHEDPSEWFSALTLTAGIGNGRFLSATKVNNLVSGSGQGINAFGSASIRIQQPVSFIADWSGQDLNLGLSITPIRTLGLFINPALADVTKTAGTSIRFVLGAGLAYSFL